MAKASTQKTTPTKRVTKTPEERAAATAARKAERLKAQQEEADRRQRLEDAFQQDAELHWNVLWALALRMEILGRDNSRWAEDHGHELVVDAVAERVRTYRSRYTQAVSDGLTRAGMSLITRQQYEAILEDLVEIRESFDRFIAEELEKRRAEEERQRLRQSAKAKLSPEELRACGLV